MNETYRVIFSGLIQSGFEEEAVRKNLQISFKFSEKQLERLFIGKSVVIKAGLDFQKAEKIKKKFEVAGALCSIKMDRDLSSDSGSPRENPASKAKLPKMICPKCKEEQEHDEHCRHCGTNIAEYEQMQIRLKVLSTRPLKRKKRLIIDPTTKKFITLILVIVSITMGYLYGFDFFYKSMLNAMDSFQLNDKYEYLGKGMDIGEQLDAIRGKGRIEGEKNLKEAEKFFNEGNLFSASRHYALARYAFQRKKNLGKAAFCSYRLGIIYDYVQLYDLALMYFQEALTYFEEAGENPARATIFHKIGQVYQGMGIYHRAEDCYVKALRDAMENSENQEITRVYLSMGSNYFEQGKFEQALRIINSENCEGEIKDTVFRAQRYNELARIYLAMEDLDLAYCYSDKAQKLFSASFLVYDKYAIWDTKADIHIARGEFDEALSVYEIIDREMEIAKSGIYNPNRPFVLMLKGRLGEALNLVSTKDAAPTWRSTPRYCLEYYSLYGQILLKRNWYNLASKKFLKAVTIAEDLRRALKDRISFISAGEFGGRQSVYQGLVESLAEMKLRFIPFDPDFGSFGKEYGESAFYFSEAMKSRSLLEKLTESEYDYFKDVKVNKVVAFFKRLISKISSIFTSSTSIPFHMQWKEYELRKQLNELEIEFEQSYISGQKLFETLTVRKKRLIHEFEALLSKIKEEYPRYASKNYPLPANPDQLGLKDKEVLIEYALGLKNIYAFHIEKSGIKRIERLEISIPQLQEKTIQLVNNVVNVRSEKFQTMLAKELYDILLSPILNNVTADNFLIIVPDGFLSNLPFEILIVEDKGSCEESVFIGDRWTISYNQSASVLGLNRSLKPHEFSKKFLGIGNPIYSETDARYKNDLRTEKGPGSLMVTPLVENDTWDGQGEAGSFRGLTILPSDHSASFSNMVPDCSDILNSKSVQQDFREITFAPLPETESEIDTIVQLIDNAGQFSDILLSENANETTLKRLPLHEYQYIHFATHADLPGLIEGIKDPFILLNQVDNDGDDGFLRLSEVLDLHLNADMIVLSACKTGLGKFIGGEGILSFSRSFQQAGAKSVVVSLWEVPSIETVNLMTSLYENIHNGDERRIALKKARNKIRMQYPHPYYWAPFVLYGD